MNEGQTTSAAPLRWSHYLSEYILCWVTWLLLAGRQQTDELVTGAVVALPVILVSVPHLSFSGLRFTPMDPRTW